MVFEAARDFAAQYHQAQCMEWDEAQFFPKEIFEKAGAFRIYGNVDS